MFQVQYLVITVLFITFTDAINNMLQTKCIFMYFKCPNISFYYVLSQRLSKEKISSKQFTPIYKHKGANKASRCHPVRLFDAHICHEHR